MDFGSEGLPFVLRPRKLRVLSNEAMSKYRRVALSNEWRRAVVKVEIRTLASALRKYDTEGYGQLSSSAFGRALREVRVSIPGLYESLSSGMGLDIEVFLAIVQFWQKEEKYTQQLEPSVLSDDWRLESEVSQLEDRLASAKRRIELRRVLTRLDPAGRGALDSELVILALTKAGIATKPITKQALTLLAPLQKDGLFCYEGLIKDSQDNKETSAWRAASFAWKRLSIKAKHEVHDAASLGHALALGGARLAAADLAIVWQRLRGLASQEIDDLFKVHDDDNHKMPSTELKVAAPRAPFATDKDETKCKPMPSSVRRTALAVRDESENEWPQADTVVAARRLRDIRRNYSAQSTPPPYWTQDLLHTQRVFSPKHKRQVSPIIFQAPSMKEAGPLSLEDIPPLARKLRRAAKVADLNVLRSAVSMVLNQDPAEEPALTRAQLQGLAQHFGLPIATGDIEILARWLDQFLRENTIMNQAECAAALLDIEQLPMHPDTEKFESELPRYGITTRPSLEHYDEDDFNDYPQYDSSAADDAKGASYDDFKESTEDAQPSADFEKKDTFSDDDDNDPPPPPLPEEDSSEDLESSPPPPHDRELPEVIVPCESSPEDKENYEPDTYLSEFAPAGMQRRGPVLRHEAPFDSESLRLSIGNKVRASPTLTTISQRGLTTSAAARLRAAFRSQAASNRDTLFQRIVARGDDDVLDLESGAVARSPDVARVLRDLSIFLTDNELRLLLADATDSEPRITDAIDESRCVRTQAIISHLHRMAKHEVLHEDDPPYEDIEEMTPSS